MRRTLLFTGAAAVIVGGAVAGVLLARGSAPATQKATLPPGTAKVIRTTLVDTKTVSGTLGYGEPAPIRAAQRGTLTWIAPVGSTTARGGPLFKVDERPVVVFYGSLPMYRPLRVGTEGRDVRQLQQNLAALGYARLAVDDTYTSVTAAAVRAWQVSLGVPASGTVAPGQVVFTPGPIRIAGQAARVGDTAGDSAVLSYTGTTRLVTVSPPSRMCPAPDSRPLPSLASAGTVTSSTADSLSRAITVALPGVQFFTWAVTMTG